MVEYDAFTNIPSGQEVSSGDEEDFIEEIGNGDGIEEEEEEEEEDEKHNKEEGNEIHTSMAFRLEAS